MRDTSKFRVLVALLAVGLLPIVSFSGCNRDEDGDESGDSDRSSGGEDRGGGTASGLESPPGSRDPGDEGWDGDDPGGGGGGDVGDNGGGSTGPGAGGDGGGSNPWGATQAEQCRPPRRPQVGQGGRAAFDQGVRAARTGDNSAARSAFQQALNNDTNHYPAAYNLGVLADRAGQTNQALEYYRRALAIAPDYERAAEGIVTVHLRRGSVPDAIAFVQPLARRFSTNLALQALYAEVLVKARRYDDAWDAARRALRCDERFVPAMIAMIKVSMQQGRKELAERILDQALEIDDNNAELHYLKGVSLRDEPGRLRDAMTQFERAVSLRPDYAEAHMALGIQLLRGANYPQALQHMQTAARLAPGLVAAHLNLGDAYRANKMWPQAKASFEKALQMQSELPQAHFNLALMYMTAGGDFPGLDSLSAMQRAVQEFTRYRDMMGPRLPRDDPSEGYLRDLNRQIDREQRRIERERAASERDSERGPREEGVE